MLKKTMEFKKEDTERLFEIGRLIVRCSADWHRLEQLNQDQRERQMEIRCEQEGI